MAGFKTWLLCEEQRIELNPKHVSKYIQDLNFKGLGDYTYMQMRKNASTADEQQVRAQMGDKWTPAYNAWEQLIASAPDKAGSWAEWYPAGKGNLLNQPETPKLYFTPGHDKDSIIGMLNGFRDLFMTLQGVALKSNLKIGFKIPTDLWKYVEENDRLVVHLEAGPDKQATTNFINEVKSAVAGWAAKHKVNLSKRTHDLGVDKGQDSYGVRMGKKFADELQQMMASKGWTKPGALPPQMLPELTKWYMTMFDQIMAGGDKAKANLHGLSA